MNEIEIIRSNLIKNGYFVLKNFFKKDEVILFRNIVEKSIEVSPKYNFRINNNNVKDYSHKRSHDEMDRTLRYYMFFHNAKYWSPEISFIINKSIKIRNEIERKWDESLTYINLKKKLQDYMIVTKYLPNLGMLKYHRDFPDPTEFPLIQFNLILSSVGLDYNGGEFVLKDNNNKELYLHKDLGADIGDVLIFNKYLLHKVEPTTKGVTDVGRWSILIGARAEYSNKYKDLIKRIKYSKLMNNFFNQ
jgi:hypothetical protein|tara:strand:+ start:18882 stop:19622 length:741 start_codon:yes stop_codon:yes gene_type:complete